MKSKETRRPWVIGHRGAMGTAPENTLASFKQGLRQGADALECDVHLSKDRRLVVIHDETLDRTTSGHGHVKDRAWDQLRRLDAGAWFNKRYRYERLITLPALLRWLRPRRTWRGEPLRLFIEVKNDKVHYPRIAEEVARALRRGGLSDRVTVISFNHATARRVKVLCPAARTGLLWAKPLPRWAARVRWAGAGAIFPRWGLVTRNLVDEAHRRGLFVGTWTVNDASAMKKMRRLNVDGITTNFPARLKKLL
jgi:glycerophosphoryl diester phosphodiesterase